MIENILNDRLIQTVLNQALQLDPQAAEKLAPLEGKKVAIKLDRRAQAWIFAIIGGQLFIDDSAMQDCDVRLSGSLAGFLQLFRNQDNNGGVNEKLYIEGDLHVAQQFQQVMSALEPDFAVALEQRFGSKLGAILNDGLQHLKTVGEQAQSQLHARVSDYFSGNESACLTREPFAQHQSRLAQMRLTLDRLEAKITQLGNH